MSIARAAKISESYRYFIVAFEQYTGTQTRGMIFHDSNRCGSVFHSFLEMAEQIEQISNQICFPAISMNDRNFKNQEHSFGRRGTDAGEWKQSELMEEHYLAVWQIALEHRYNASWQGYTKNCEIKESIPFRSFLELIEQLDGVLSHPEASKEEPLPVKDPVLLCGLGAIPSSDGASYLLQSGDVNFRIQILFRENQTWQGILRCQEMRQEIHFRSFLELLKLMEEASEEIVYENRRYAEYQIARASVNQVFNNKRRIR